MVELCMLFGAGFRECIGVFLSIFEASLSRTLCKEISTAMIHLLHKRLARSHVECRSAHSTLTRAYGNSIDRMYVSRGQEVDIGPPLETIHALSRHLYRISELQVRSVVIAVPPFKMLPATLPPSLYASSVAQLNATYANHTEFKTSAVGPPSLRNPPVFVTVQHWRRKRPPPTLPTSIRRNPRSLGP